MLDKWRAEQKIQTQEISLMIKKEKNPDLLQTLYNSTSFARIMEFTNLAYEPWLIWLFLIDLFVDPAFCTWSLAQKQLMSYLAIWHSVSSKFPIMEDLCQRIPCVAVMIFKNLNDQSLIKSKEASSEISQFMLNERFYWLRFIMNYNKNFLEYQALWKKFVEKTPMDIIQQIAVAVQTFFTERTSRQDM